MTNILFCYNTINQLHFVEKEFIMQSRGLSFRKSYNTYNDYNSDEDNNTSFHSCLDPDKQINENNSFNLSQFKKSPDDISQSRFLQNPNQIRPQSESKIFPQQLRSKSHIKQDAEVTRDQISKEDKSKICDAIIKIHMLRFENAYKKTENIAINQNITKNISNIEAQINKSSYGQIHLATIIREQKFSEDKNICLILAQLITEIEWTNPEAQKILIHALNEQKLGTSNEIHQITAHVIAKIKNPDDEIQKRIMIIIRDKKFGTSNIVHSLLVKAMSNINWTDKQAQAVILCVIRDKKLGNDIEIRDQLTQIISKFTNINVDAQISLAKIIYEQTLGKEVIILLPLTKMVGNIVWTANLAKMKLIKAICKRKFGKNQTIKETLAESIVTIKWENKSTKGANYNYILRILLIKKLFTTKSEIVNRITLAHKIASITKNNNFDVNIRTTQQEASIINNIHLYSIEIRRILIKLYGKNNTHIIDMIKQNIFIDAVQAHKFGNEIKIKEEIAKTIIDNATFDMDEVIASKLIVICEEYYTIDKQIFITLIDKFSKNNIFCIKYIEYIFNKYATTDEQKFIALMSYVNLKNIPDIAQKIFAKTIELIDKINLTAPMVQYLIELIRTINTKCTKDEQILLINFICNKLLPFCRENQSIHCSINACIELITIMNLTNPEACNIFAATIFAEKFGTDKNTLKPLIELIKRNNYWSVQFKDSLIEVIDYEEFNNNVNTNKIILPPTLQSFNYLQNMQMIRGNQLNDLRILTHADGYLAVHSTDQPQFMNKYNDRRILNNLREDESNNQTIFATMINFNTVQKFSYTPKKYKLYPQISTTLLPNDKSMGQIIFSDNNRMFFCINTKYTVIKNIASSDSMSNFLSINKHNRSTYKATRNIKDISKKDFLTKQKLLETQNKKFSQDVDAGYPRLYNEIVLKFNMDCLLGFGVPIRFNDNLIQQIYKLIECQLFYQRYTGTVFPIYIYNNASTSQIATIGNFSVKIQPNNFFEISDINVILEGINTANKYQYSSIIIEGSKYELNNNNLREEINKEFLQDRNKRLQELSSIIIELHNTKELADLDSSSILQTHKLTNNLAAEFEKYPEINQQKLKKITNNNDKLINLYNLKFRIEIYLEQLYTLDKGINLLQIKDDISWYNRLTQDKK